MIATTAFIRGKAAVASKKKGHGSWKPHDQSKKHTDKRPDFRGHSRDGRGASRFTPLTRTQKEILAAEANKFQPPPPMVTSVEKRNSNKFCDFHNDKGHSTDECMQLKKQIEDDYITDGVQRRDCMAARTTNTPSDYRRRHPFYQSMDEFHGRKVVVALQR
nr:reverse transcriptase domain-containing protein [Tanacetum cinerariifolium]